MHPQTPTAPQNPFFVPMQRTHLTEEELNKPIDVIKVSVYGKYSMRGEHRKEVIEGDYEAMVEVPASFNVGHIKLAANRHVRHVLKGIRVRTYNHDRTIKPEPVEHKRRIRDFMSEKGIRDNERMRRDYEREVRKRQEEMAQMAAGAPPQFMDDTQYGADGLAPISDGKTYLT